MAVAPPLLRTVWQFGTLRNILTKNFTFHLIKGVFILPYFVLYSHDLKTFAAFPIRELKQLKSYRYNSLLSPQLKMGEFQELNSRTLARKFLKFLLQVLATPNIGKAIFLHVIPTNSIPLVCMNLMKKLGLE